jgi:hypothetical protein
MRSARQPLGPAYAIPLSHDELALVGRFITTWNQVEMLMDMIIHVILGVNLVTVSKLMGSPNIRPHVDILVAVVNEKISDKVITDKLDQCTKRILALSDFRNSIVHSAWFGAATGGDATGHKDFTDKNPITMKLIAEKTEAVTRLTNRIADIFWEIGHRINPAAFQFVPSPWHDKF